MALAGDDLWTKFDCYFDRLLILEQPFVTEPSASAGLKREKGGGRAQLIVNDVSGSYFQRRHKREADQSRVPDIGDMIISCNTGSFAADMDGGAGGGNSCDLGSCLDDLTDLNMDGGIDMDFDEDDDASFRLPDSILLGLLDGDESSEPLRRDCMWSGDGGTKLAGSEVRLDDSISNGCSSAASFGDHLMLEQLVDSSCGNVQLLSCSPPTTAAGTASMPPSVNSDLLLSSADASDASDNEESSDLDEMTVCRSVQPKRRQRIEAPRVGNNPTHSDHSYISTSSSTSGRFCEPFRSRRSPPSLRYANDILTPEESSSSSSSSSDDEDDYVRRSRTRIESEAVATADDAATFRVPVPPVALRRTATSKSSKIPMTKSTKFRFHIKFKPGGPTASRSVLRRCPVTQTNYVRRRADVSATRLLKEAFYPTGAAERQQQQSLEISQTKVVRGEGDWTSAKLHRDAAPGVVVVKRREVRDLHNSLERQRRTDLKNAFETLKFSVPDIATSDKASKLVILTKARDFCVRLAGSEAQLRREKERQRVRKESLAVRLRQLQRDN